MSTYSSWMIPEGSFVELMRTKSNRSRRVIDLSRCDYLDRRSERENETRRLEIKETESTKRQAAWSKNGPMWIFAAAIVVDVFQGDNWLLQVLLALASRWGLGLPGIPPKNP